MIHRDVKPQNVIVRVDDGVGRRAKLMDFGIASLAGAPALTATGEVVGTLAYMAPEQAEGEAAGEPADTYSLALTLYELWAGTNPVARATPAHTAREIGQPLPSLREYRPDLPEAPHRLRRRLPAPGAGAAPLAGRAPRAASRPRFRRLTAQRPVPPPSADEHREPAPAGCGPPSSWRSPPGAWRSPWSAAALGRPGLALMLGALTAPAILVASRLAWAPLPLLAPLLGALSAAPVYPAVAGSRGTALERGVLGALGWCWLLVGAATLGLGSRLGLDPHGAGRLEPLHGRCRQRALLSPLLAPEALLGRRRLRAGRGRARGDPSGRARRPGAARGPAVVGRARGRASVGRRGGGLAGRPLLIAAAALVAVIVEFRRRPPRPAGRPAPIPRARPAIQGGGSGGMP